MNIRRPFDAHVHLRDGDMLRAVAPATAAHCDAALVMPNLVPPVTTRERLYVASWTPGGDVSERISMEPFPEALKNLDKNKNKKIAKTELPDGSPVAAPFFRIDLDQDGELDAGEECLATKKA